MSHEEPSESTLPQEEVEVEAGGAEEEEYKEHGDPELENGNLSCAGRDWTGFPGRLLVIPQLKELTKTIDLSYNLLS